MASRHYEVRRWLAVDVTGVPLGGVVARPSLQARLFARSSGADEAAVRSDLAALAGHLAEVERLRTEGVIGGAEPNAADFQIASSLQSIAKLGDLAPYVAGPLGGPLGRDGRAGAAGADAARAARGVAGAARVALEQLAQRARKRSFSAGVP